jgi:transposase InsO family protein
LKIECLRLDNGGEFTTNEFEEFCEAHGIRRQYSTTRNPQQNGVVKRKKRNVQEITRTMLNEAKLSYIYWREAIYTSFYILNKGKIRVNSDRTSYEL